MRTPARARTNAQGYTLRGDFDYTNLKGETPGKSEAIKQILFDENDKKTMRVNDLLVSRKDKWNLLGNFLLENGHLPEDSFVYARQKKLNKHGEEYSSGPICATFEGVEYRMVGRSIYKYKTSGSR